MRVLIQRVSEASVKIKGKINGEIKQGLVFHNWRMLRRIL